MSYQLKTVRLVENDTLPDRFTSLITWIGGVMLDGKIHYFNKKYKKGFDVFLEQNGNSWKIKVYDNNGWGCFSKKRILNKKFKSIKVYYKFSVSEANPEYDPNDYWGTTDK